MSKHNSGPWKITHTALNGYRVSDSTGWGVAIVLKDVNDEANAHLIAAAPQMLEALEAAISALEDASCLGFNLTEQIKKVDAAIRAANGEV